MFIMLLITSLQLHSQLSGYHRPLPRVTDGNNQVELKNTPTRITEKIDAKKINPGKPLSETTNAKKMILSEVPTKSSKEVKSTSQKMEELPSSTIKSIFVQMKPSEHRYTLLNKIRDEL